jgi:hypothetical protein
MPGNWDPVQNINANTGWVEWPQGPLALNPGEIPTWIEAWVLQSTTGPVPVQGVGGTGSSQSSRQMSGWPPGYTRWTADGPPPGWLLGRFQPGPAVGIALLSSLDTSTSPPTNKFYWWTSVVVLY